MMFLSSRVFFNNSIIQDYKDYTFEPTALNGFSLTVDLHYVSGGSEISEKDLVPGTYIDALRQIEQVTITLHAEKVPFEFLNRKSYELDMKKFDITVVGETDGKPSKHTAKTSPNDKPSGNPALAQDRANNLKNKLGYLGGREVKTSIVNHTGAEIQQNRKSRINHTPKNYK